MNGDFIDIIFNCPFGMHESLADEDYSKIIYKLKDEHKELMVRKIAREQAKL